MSPFKRPATVRHGDRLVARSVLLILLALYTATFVGLPENPDSEVEFQTTSSLARTGTFALGGTPEAEGILTARHGVHEGGPGREGRFYSWFGVGQALGGMPFYLAGRGLDRLLPRFEERHRTTTTYGVGRSEYFEHLIVGWRNPLLGALTALLIVLTSIRIGASRRHAWVAGLAYGICTFAWPQARSTLSDVQATFCLFLAFHLLVKLRESYRRYLPPPRLDMALFGFALGAAFMTRVAVAPVVAVLLLAAIGVVRFGRRRTLAGGVPFREGTWMLLPAVACLGAWLAINHLRFGSMWETGYGEAVGAGFFSYPPLRGALALFLAPGKGLLFLAPGLLLVPIWILRQIRNGDPLVGWTLLAVVVATIAPIAPMESWHGAWTYGPRYILPLLPFLWLAVAPTLDALEECRGRRVLGYGLLLAGIATSLPGVLVDYPTHHDLALQAARIEWPEMPGDTEQERDGARFLNIQYDFRFAAPWAHWRILRRRLAVGDERFPVREIFLLDHDAILSPTHERDRGMRHFAWVDFRERLKGPGWPAVLICLAFLIGGIVFAIRGLDPDQH
jgi:hypothetical protein